MSRLLLPAAINRFVNPAVRANVDNWIGSAGVTVDWLASLAGIGNPATNGGILRSVTSGTGTTYITSPVIYNSPATGSIAVTPGETYMQSFYYHCESFNGAGTLLPYVWWYKSDNTASATPSSIGATITTVNAAFVRVDTVFTAPADAAKALPGFRQKSAAFTAYTTGFQWGAPNLAPYFDGSYGYCAWAATADASASSRAVSSLIYDASDYLSPDALTIAMRIAPTWEGDGYAESERTILTVRNALDNADVLTLRRMTSAKWQVDVLGTQPHAAESPAHIFTADTEHVVVLRFSNSDLDLHINVDGTDYHSHILPATAFTVGNLVFGPHVYFGPVVLSDYKWSTEKTALFTAGDGALFDAPVDVYDVMPQNGLLLPLVNKSTGYAHPAGSQIVLCFEGDSHTEAMTNYDDFPGQIMESPAPNGWEFHSVATGGQSLIGGIDTQRAAQIDPLWYGLAAANIVVIFAGANDLDGSTTAVELYYALHAYVDDLKNHTWRVIVCTLYGKNDAPFNVKRNAFNAMLRAPGGHHFADGLADLAADSRIGADDSYLDATYFIPGEVHLTRAGKTVTAGIVKAAIESLL